MSRIMIAGTGSGCGKTSMVCGLLSALQHRGMQVAACKCGPDYIDPMFHQEVLQTPCRNLDLFLCGEQAVEALLAKSEAGAELVVIEGVMGFYDGLDADGTASSHHLADCTQTPVILVVGCAGKSLSLAAEVQGYTRFRPNTVAGVVLNRCSARTYPMMKQMIEQHTGVKVLGYLPNLPEAALESRHLGLVTAAEVENLQNKMNILAEHMEQTVDIDALIQIAQSAPERKTQSLSIPAVGRVRIAVAKDAACCFMYQDNLDLLEMMGAEIVPFSPLADSRLPDHVQGLWLAGGYPELYAAQIAQNTALLQSIHQAVSEGLPTIAECGGFILLGQTLQTLDGRCYPMAGVLQTEVQMTKRLSRFGYLTMTAASDNLLCRAGEQIKAHEFHYSESSDLGDGFTAEKQNGVTWKTGHAAQTLYAGYPHLHLWGCMDAAKRWMEQCLAYGNRSGRQ